MKAVAGSELGSAQWNALCAASRQAWLFHRAEWTETETQFFVSRNLSFGLQDGAALAAVQPLYLSECGLGTWTERLLHSGIHRHTGLALADTLNASGRRAARSAAMHRIFELAAELDADRIQLNAHNLAPESLSAERQEIPFWVEEHGFHLGLNFGPGGMLPAPGLSTCCADQLVDLTPAETDLFGALDESCRRAVRKAGAGGLAFEAAAERQAVSDYYRIATLSAQRTGETLAPVAYFEALWDRFQTTGNCAFLFAMHEERRVAGLILALDKQAASFLGGVSDPDYLPLRVNDFLHWSALRWARAAGLKVYRFGPAFPEVPADWPIARVSRFKAKFGGRSIGIIQGSYFRHPERYRAAAQDHIAGLCERGAADRALLVR